MIPTVSRAMGILLAMTSAPNGPDKSIPESQFRERQTIDHRLAKLPQLDDLLPERDFDLFNALKSDTPEALLGRFHAI